LGAGSFHPAMAVPAFPEPTEAVQPDGTRFQLHLRGDEYFSWHETSEGYVIVTDRDDNFWKYARPVAGTVEFRPIFNAHVGTANPIQLGLRKQDLPAPEILRQILKERRPAGRGEPEELPAPGPEVELPSEPAEPPPQGIPVSGVKAVKNIVILAAFSNHWDAANGTVMSGKGRVAGSEYVNLFNQTNHTTDSAVGSVRVYFR